MLLALAAAVAAGAGGPAPRKQLLRHPVLATEVALPLSGSRVLLGGKLKHQRTGLVILRQDGSIDSHFGRNGVAHLPRSAGTYFYGEEFGSPVAVDGKGRILFVEPREEAVRRLLPNGRPDRSFGDRGTAVVKLGEQHADVTSVGVQPDGKIVVGGGTGCSHYGCTETPGVARLTERGLPDRSFGQGGSKVLSGRYRGEEPRVMGLTVGPSGEIFAVSGGYASSLTIQRLGPDGELDRSFGRTGSLIVGQAGPARRGLFTRPKIEVMRNGKLVVGAQVELHGGVDDMVAFRYLANGRPDPSFGRNGHVVLRAGVNAFTTAVAVAPSGKVVLSGDGVGKAKRYFLVAALRPDGIPDPAVGDGGFAKVKVASESSAQSLVLQGKTAIAIGYTANPRTEVRRTLLARIPLSR